MNDYDIKPSIELHNDYKNALLKLTEAMHAIQKLTPAEKERLAFEYFNIKTKEELIQAVLRTLVNL